MTPKNEKCRETKYFLKLFKCSACDLIPIIPTCNTVPVEQRNRRTQYQDTQ